MSVLTHHRSGRHGFRLPTLVLGALALGLAASWRLSAHRGTPLPYLPTESLPPGVQDSVILTDMDHPVALAIDAEGRIFYTEKDTGRVRLIVNGQLQPQAVITVPVRTVGEAGLIGIAFDPDYALNHFMYIYHTSPDPVENRIVRFEEVDGVALNPTIVYTFPHQARSWDMHIGGNLHFGPDGRLYVTVGEDGTPTLAQDLGNPHGKIHRFNATVPLSPPPDNPFYTTPGAVQSIWALGLRNSFDFDFDPLTGWLWASENGPTHDDEINLLVPGGNYGWPVCIGPCDPPDPRYIDPQWGWTPVIAPTAVKFYSGNQIPQWRNQLFMCSFLDRQLRHLILDAGRQNIVQETIVEGVPCTLDMEIGPDGSIYYIEGGGWSNGTLHRLWSASVSIVKFNDPYGAVQPGQRITYTISYANTSSDPLTDVIITDTVPSGTILDPASVYPTATVVADLIYWPLPTLMPGASQQVGFSILLPSPTATPVETPSPPSSMARSPSPLVDTSTPVAGCPANAQVCNLAWIYTDQTGRWQPSNPVYNPSERYYMPLALKSP